MEFIWNDGGRAASGYVGLAGDCVVRAIAIASGAVYRDVYKELGAASEKSPRDGIRADIASDYLAQRDWQRWEGYDRPFVVDHMPKGVLIVHLAIPGERSQHFCTLIDRVVHDTWNPAEDNDYVVKSYWTLPTVNADTTLPVTAPKQRFSREQELTQEEFDRILQRLRALDATASNRASTEGEKRNALRMMQNLMLRHNLSRDDIVDEDNIEHVQFTRMACPVNGRRACSWEKSLAAYVCHHVFPTIQWYKSTRGHRTLIWFYGPLADVRNGIALYRELLLTIATAAHLQYGSHVQGSGASYAEGYVSGLPRSPHDGNEKHEPNKQVSRERALIHTRMLTLQNAATQWLDRECNVKLVTRGGRGRWGYDQAAAFQGKLHGAKHTLNVPGAPPRITHRGS